MKKHHPINSEIAGTYITANKKLTFVAALGIALGMSVYIFMNSMMAGFNRASSEAVFRSMPHIRLYNEEQLGRPLSATVRGQAMPVVVNPGLVPSSAGLHDPVSVEKLLRNHPEVVRTGSQVLANVFLGTGGSQIPGQVLGIVPDEADAMFGLNDLTVQGNYAELNHHPNGILLGVGIAERLGLRTGDNITVLSSKNTVKTFKIIGLFQSNNAQIDKTRAYVPIAAARQLLQQNAQFVSDININIRDFEQAERVARELSTLTGYKAENWQAANETLVAAARMRFIVISFVSITILLVAGFGIYNILNMTISQKLNDIAILKAMGFKGRDVVRIFVRQAMIIGLMGTAAGVVVAWLLVQRLSNVYVGGDIGFFPISFEPLKFAQGIVFGLAITFLAGFLPARKAAKVDPVSIFRK